MRIKAELKKDKEKIKKKHGTLVLWLLISQKCLERFSTNLASRLQYCTGTSGFNQIMDHRATKV